MFQEEAKPLVELLLSLGREYWWVSAVKAFFSMVIVVT
jgi:hypothetical protein